MALAADPAGNGLLSYLRDSTLAPFTRTVGAEALVTGFCLNTREVLFGVDPGRRIALSKADSALSDLPRASELVRLMRNDLDLLITDPSAAVEAGGGVRLPRRLRPFRWIGLGGVLDRLAFCGFLTP
jgi:hypothetical protein